jgi:hypothetical protein
MSSEKATCAICDKKAVVIDHLHPYHQEMNRCKEHKGVPYTSPETTQEAITRLTAERDALRERCERLEAVLTEWQSLCNHWYREDVLERCGGNIIKELAHKTDAALKPDATTDERRRLERELKHWAILHRTQGGCWIHEMFNKAVDNLLAHEAEKGATDEQ